MSYQPEMLGRIDREQLSKILGAPYLYKPFMAEFPGDRWPCTVRYDHRGTFYVPRDHFAFDPKRPGPSDCVWIIPGTAEPRR
jgi:hypothetical protein